MPEPLNKPDNFDMPSTSGTKEFPVEEVTPSSETSSVQSEPADKKQKQKSQHPPTAEASKGSEAAKESEIQEESLRTKTVLAISKRPFLLS